MFATEKDYAIFKNVNAEKQYLIFPCPASKVEVFKKRIWNLPPFEQTAWGYCEAEFVLSFKAPDEWQFKEFIKEKFEGTAEKADDWYGEHGWYTIENINDFSKWIEEYETIQNKRAEEFQKSFLKQNSDQSSQTSLF
jgi:hypothetical protein